LRVQELIKDVKSTLANQGVQVEFTTKEGTWTEPGMVEFDYAGEHHILPFWAGTYSDKHLASSIYDEVLRLIGSQAQR
jgi:hypothetical protein